MTQQHGFSTNAGNEGERSPAVAFEAQHAGRSIGGGVAGFSFAAASADACSQQACAGFACRSRRSLQQQGRKLAAAELPANAINITRVAALRGMVILPTLCLFGRSVKKSDDLTIDPASLR
ncbi:MAG TPA: hypothetical protein VF306_07725 [Pirellulales bacterium]